MPPCHQCGTPTDAPRNGPCSICKLDAQGFCATCALWELGPLPAPAGLPRSFRVHDAPLVPVKPCPLQRGRRDLSVDRLARDCALLTQQREARGLAGAGRQRSVAQAAAAAFSPAIPDRNTGVGARPPATQVLDMSQLPQAPQAASSDSTARHSAAWRAAGEAGAPRAGSKWASSSRSCAGRPCSAAAWPAAAWASSGVHAA